MSSRETLSHAQVRALWEVMRDHDGQDVDLTWFDHGQVRWVVYSDDVDVIAAGWLSAGGHVTVDAVSVR